MYMYMYIVYAYIFSMLSEAKKYEITCFSL